MAARFARRRVLGWIAVIAVAGAGLTALAIRRPASPLVRMACEGDGEMPRVLVAYATRAGSTAEVAERVAQRLCAAGMSAEAKPVDEVTDLAVYDAAILGSGIYYGTWLGPMTTFVQAEAERLQRIPVALFTLHMLNLGDTPESQAERAKYTAAARDAVSPVEEAFFAGRVEPSRLSLIERLAVRVVGSPVGDQRDWSRIDSWADGVAARVNLV